MTVQPSGTDAKDIALHFMKQTGVERATPAIIAKTINQAKSILKAGYTKEEVISVIDHLIDRGTRMYSIGYVSTAINTVLEEIQALKEKEEAKRVAQQIEEQALQKRNEVANDGSTSTRNQSKAGRLGVQSRFGKKFDFDMFEE